MKRALISVYDKEGIVDFAKGLTDLGWEIISTGGTKRLLEEEGLGVIGIEEVTGFPEILDGRVKTLNPMVHGGILYRRDKKDHVKTIEEKSIHPIDMVVCSLYPFEETLKREGVSEEEIIENIDIGGPTMIRSAAKNFKDVIVVTDKADYDNILEKERSEGLGLEERKTLALKAFSLTAFYDSMISSYLRPEEMKFPTYLTKGYRLKNELRYGENPHQEGAYYEDPLLDDFDFDQIHGKAISYNNYNDVYRTVGLLKEFDECACVCVKHTNPSGVALGKDSYEAYTRAYECDPISIFGGIIAFNREVDKACAEKMSEIFLEIIIAPSFTEEALEVLTQKENIRLIISKNISTAKGRTQTTRETVGGVIVQDEDLELYKDGLNLAGGPEADEATKRDLDFAWKVVKHCSSNAIVLVKDGRTIGLGHGEVRRVWALEDALKRTEFDLDGAVAGSDGFFFEDTIELLNEYKIGAVVEPGGSVKDPGVIEGANKHGISLYFTGMRHFKH